MQSGTNQGNAVLMDSMNRLSNMVAMLSAKVSQQQAAASAGGAAGGGGGGAAGGAAADAGGGK